MGLVMDYSLDLVTVKLKLMAKHLVIEKEKVKEKYLVTVKDLYLATDLGTSLVKRTDLDLVTVKVKCFLILKEK